MHANLPLHITAPEKGAPPQTGGRNQEDKSTRAVRSLSPNRNTSTNLAKVAVSHNLVAYKGNFRAPGPSGATSRCAHRWASQTPLWCVMTRHVRPRRNDESFTSRPWHCAAFNGLLGNRDRASQPFERERAIMGQVQACALQFPYAAAPNSAYALCRGLCIDGRNAQTAVLRQPPFWRDARSSQQTFARDGTMSSKRPCPAV